MAEFDYHQRPFSKTITDAEYDVAVGKVPPPAAEGMDPVFSAETLERFAVGSIHKAQRGGYMQVRLPKFCTDPAPHLSHTWGTHSFCPGTPGAAKTVKQFMAETDPGYYPELL